MNNLIRKATISDAPALEDLNNKYFHEEGRDWKELVTSDVSEMFILEDGNEILGFTGVKYHDWNKTIKIVDIFILPIHRRKGLGSELVGYLLNYLKDKKYRTLISEAPSLNPVLGLYLKKGFRICGFNDRLYSNNGKEIALFLSYDLP